MFVAFVIMAAGMALTMAPATESIMGSLPRDKAGVGSAVNDTTRQVGGALGVAIIGSVYSSVYAGSIASAIAAARGLPARPTWPPGHRLDRRRPGRGQGRSAAQPGEALADAARPRLRRTACTAACSSVPSSRWSVPLVALLFLPARAPEDAADGIDPTEPNLFDDIEANVFDDTEPLDPADGGDDVDRGAASLVPS